MSKIEFISSDLFPQDEYTKELVYLCLDEKYRVAYVRKSAKNGGMFWSVATVGATRNGQKEFFPAFLQDSNFFEKDIKEFLDKRKWEKSASSNQSNSIDYPRKSEMSEAANNDQLPF